MPVAAILTMEVIVSTRLQALMRISTAIRSPSPVEVNLLTQFLGAWCFVTEIQITNTASGLLLHRIR